MQELFRPKYGNIMEALRCIRQAMVRSAAAEGALPRLVIQELGTPYLFDFSLVSSDFSENSASAQVRSCQYSTACLFLQVVHVGKGTAKAAKAYVCCL